MGHHWFGVLHFKEHVHMHYRSGMCWRSSYIMTITILTLYFYFAIDHHHHRHHYHHHHHHQFNTHECSMNNIIHDKTHAIKHTKMIQKEVIQTKII